MTSHPPIHPPPFFADFTPRFRRIIRLVGRGVAVVAFTWIILHLYAHRIHSEKRDPAPGTPSAKVFELSHIPPIPRETARSKPFADLIAGARWKRNIVTTVFWIGETPTKCNPRSNTVSAWDPRWQQHFGGVDDPVPSHRTGFRPVSFIPRCNPFYVALPYNDLSTNGMRPEAPFIIPWFYRDRAAKDESVCKGKWIAVRCGDRTCYAQWEDVGPFATDHWQYVFGSDRPRTNPNSSAGLDVSPSVRDFLGISDFSRTDWRFVEANEVPRGPWLLYGQQNGAERELVFARGEPRATLSVF